MAKNKKKILMVGGEAMPFAATGGLGDVLGSLPASVQAEMKDADVRLVMPLYSAMKQEYRKMLQLLLHGVSSIVVCIAL